MPSGLIQRGGNRYDAVYEHPHGGVASNTDPSDLQPSQLVIGDGLFIKNGRLCTAGWSKSYALNYSDIAGKNYFSGEAVIRLITILLPNTSHILCAFTDLNRVYVYDVATSRFVLDQVMAPPAANPTIYDIQVIAGVAYVSLFEEGAIYAYIPFSSYTLATNFVGGKYLMEILGYLIAANTNQPTDIPAVKFNRFNWSSPYGYTTWDPAIDRTSGFITISEVQDELTGAFAMGNVGYMLRDQGVSQLTPTGIGIQPFDVTPLWESQYGIGCTYPDTFDQYGNLAIWFNDNNGYAFFSGNMPQGITGAAQAAIFEDINNVEDTTTGYSRISGAFFNCSENSNIPELTYVLSIVYGTYDGNSLFGVFWTYNIDNKTWTRQLVNLLPKITQLSAKSKFLCTRAMVQGVLYTQATNTLNATNKRITGSLALYGNDTSGSGIVYSFMFPFFNSDKGEPVAGAGDVGNYHLLYREEEIRLGTKPTVRGVIVKACGTGILRIYVSGVEFTPILVNTAVPKVYKSYGIHSDVNPQLEIIGDGFEGTVIKANMPITFAEGEPT